jgi:hypothetical protein
MRHHRVPARELDQIVTFNIRRDCLDACTAAAEMYRHITKLGEAQHVIAAADAAARTICDLYLMRALRTDNLPAKVATVLEHALLQGTSEALVQDWAE